MKPTYKRIIIKVSGESLAPSNDTLILDKGKLTAFAETVRAIREKGVQVAVVVGAGNIWRGRQASAIGIEKTTADYMGMLGTIMNALAIQSAIEELGLRCRVMSSIEVNQVCEPYIRRRAIARLEEGCVVIFAGGTGNPYFTTDSTATLRALEIEADAILMAKNGVNGVFDSDPRVNPNAKIIPHLTFHELIEKQLAVMDLTAVAMLEGKDIVIHVFNTADTENYFRVLDGEKIGTIITK